MQKHSSETAIVKTTYITFLLIIITWIGAWHLKIWLESSFSLLAAGWGSFLYWTTAKVLIWILPALRLLRNSNTRLGSLFNFGNWKGWLRWGGGVGLLIALTGIIPNYLQGKPIFQTQFSVPLLNVLVIAPIFEEILMRGALLTNLQKGYSFAAANLVTSLMFLVLHLPGWYFMGVLVENLTNPVGGALSIFLCSLAFGYAAHRSNSVMGGILSLFLNNLF